MKRLLAWSEHTARRAGITGALGAALIAIVPGYYFTVVQPLLWHIDALRNQIAAHAQTTSSAAPEADNRSRQARIDAFHGFFPPSGDLPIWLEKIYRAAEAEHLQLVRGEYRPVSEHTGRPYRIQVVLPVKGSYVQIRRFIANSLASVPILALEEIVIQRGGANDPLIDAQLRFSLFVGNSP